MSKKQKGTVSTRACVAMLALVLMLGCAVGGTIAWLTAQTDPVVNTFTVGDVEILLAEHEYNGATNTLNMNKTVTENTYKIVPGTNLPKDPFITVVPGSEDCWLFLKVEEENFINGLSYDLCYYWEKVPGETNVYYCNLESDAYPNGEPVTGGTSLKILREIWENGVETDNTIKVSGDITKAQLDALGNKQPKLKFTAYAVQYSIGTSYEAAWNLIKDQVKATPAPASTPNP